MKPYAMAWDAHLFSSSLVSRSVARKTAAVRFTPARTRGSRDGKGAASKLFPLPLEEEYASADAMEDVWSIFKFAQAKVELYKFPSIKGCALSRQITTLPLESPKPHSMSVNTALVTADEREPLLTGPGDSKPPKYTATSEDAVLLADEEVDERAAESLPPLSQETRRSWSIIGWRAFWTLLSILIVASFVKAFIDAGDVDVRLSSPSSLLTSEV